MIRALRVAVQTLFDIPMWLIGLFGAVYGLSGLSGFLLYNVYLLSQRMGQMEIAGAVQYGLFVLLACPLFFSRRPLSETLYRCGITRVLLIWLLGVPKDRFLRAKRSSWRGLPVVTVVLALAAGIWSSQLSRFVVFQQISSAWYPLVVPLGLLLVTLIGMVITVPETGVVLSCTCMAFLWTDTQWSLWLLLAVIAVTWIGYVVQLLQAHRTLRFDVLDHMVLLFGVVILFGGAVGYRAGGDSMQRAAVLFALLSLYFPIVNLMVTRTHIKRCWVGVCITACFVAISMSARYIQAEELRWLELVWPRLGTVVADGFANTVHWLADGDPEWQSMFLVLCMPLLCAFFFRCRRLLWRVVIGLLFSATVVLIVASGSRGAFVAMVISLLLMCFMSHHRALAFGILALPVAGGVWLWSPLLPSAWRGIGRRLADWLSSWGGLYLDRYWDGIRQIIRTHPAGIGLRDGAFEALYPFFASSSDRPYSGSGSLYLDILITLGIPGLLIFGMTIFFFVQKSVTTLSRSGGSLDRLLILGGLTGVIGVLLFGAARSMGDGIMVYVGFWMVVALINAYGNVVETETAALAAHCMRRGKGQGHDFVGRIG